MSEYYFSPAAAERTISPPIRSAAGLMADGLRTTARPDAVFEEMMREMGGTTFGQVILSCAEVLLPFDPVLGVDEERGVAIGAAFVMGGVFMFKAIQRGDEILMAKLNKFVHTKFGRGPGEDIDYTEQDAMVLGEELHASASGILSEGSGGLLASGLEDTLEAVEERIIPQVDAQQYFRLGAGWTIYQATMADLSDMDHQMQRDVDWDAIDWTTPS